MKSFTNHDLEQIAYQGQTEESVEQQIHHFETGFPFLKLQQSATKDNHGILSFEGIDAHQLVSFYEEQSIHCQVVKFVPASGAASRMFKDLFAFINEDKESQAVEAVLTNLKKFAFYNELQWLCRSQEIDLNQPLSVDDKKRVISLILNQEGLNYGNLPKGLIRFHHYEEEARLAVEEHLVEGALYARNSKNEVYIHFTVSPEHQVLFQKAILQSVKKYEERFCVTFHISFSVQKKSTDTIAVNLDNTPFRNTDGSLLFRPSGHGALIENLNDLPQEIVFIKNIDNVVPDRLKSETVYYKKLIGGLLLKTKNEVHDILKRLKTEPKAAITEGKKFLSETLQQSFDPCFETKSEQDQTDILFSMLNKPIRVCGMVKNEGEPGGGPFFVEDGTLQIVESSQVDKKDPKQAAIMAQSTHFNPVDLVCYTKDFEGKSFNLLQFVDADTGFISEKSKDGKPLKAQELPGLWNGAMAHWITLFVEVPLITFNPVKTIDDLLRKEHC
ncbi:MAG: DUF4301 family protein [Bacteroidales bacterium]|nr:DUF4301 family protein [Bacteroidales bacterium]